MHHRAGFGARVYVGLHCEQHLHALNVASGASNHHCGVAIFILGIQVGGAQFMQDLLRNDSVVDHVQIRKHSAYPKAKTRHQYKGLSTSTCAHKFWNDNHHSMPLEMTANRQRHAYTG